jgi:hypothetical protein
VINQPDAVSNIAVPTFETKLAVHITVKARCPNGPHREGAGSVDAAAVVRSEPLMTFSGNHISLQASLDTGRVDEPCTNGVRTPKQASRTNPVLTPSGHPAYQSFRGAR